MPDWKIEKAPAIHAEMTVPGDKSISHRAIMFAALANGRAEITGFLPGEDCLSTMKAFQQLGIPIERTDETTVIIEGKRGHFTAPSGDIDCGNSGTTMRLMCGILAAQPFRSRLTGDASLSKRPMKRIIDPLTQMGAKITAEGAKGSAPLVIEGGPLKGIEYTSPVASAQVKSAVLLAGLFAKGTTTVTEPVLSRDHTERMLAWHLVRPRRNGLSVSVSGGQTLESRDFAVPGDISSAAFWLVAAAAHPGSHLLIKDVGLNPARTGVLAVLIRMGAHVSEIVEHSECEPRRTIIRDAHELRVKETDRIAAVAKNLRAFGVLVDEKEDGMEIEGGAKLRGATVESFGDHRIAMAFAILATFAEGASHIRDTACVDTSYPGFYEMLHKLAKPEPSEIPVISSLRPE